MSQPVTIEVGGESVGIARPENGIYRFFAVKYDVWPIDGQSFPSIPAAVAAATKAMTRPGPEGCTAC